MIACQCIGCSRSADLNVGGKFVCSEHYLRPDHLYFPWPEPQRFRDRHPLLFRIFVGLFVLYFVTGTICGLVGLWRAG